MTRQRSTQASLHEIWRLSDSIESQGGSLQIMEVCGSHTTAIAACGLRELLPAKLRLLSGPGCPVCVTPPGMVEAAIDLAHRDDVIVATFGDMMRVPAAGNSLEAARSRGAHVQVVYSPSAALELARKSPDKTVVFVAVGFETTAPTVAATLLAAERQSVDNLLFLVSHKLVPPALEALLAAGEVPLGGFLLPGHVSTVIGAGAYRQVLKKYGVPGVVAGFEPGDLIGSILQLLRRIDTGRPAVDNHYERVVTEEGNLRAQQVMAQAFQVVDAVWRGMGSLPRSGLELHPRFAHRDARALTAVSLSGDAMPPGCCCGDVLQGKIRPHQCSIFGTACTPETPVGPCMVSSEGSCAAAYRYGETL